jgi:hypothetical protein
MALRCVRCRCFCVMAVFVIVRDVAVCYMALLVVVGMIVVIMGCLRLLGTTLGPSIRSALT